MPNADTSVKKECKALNYGTNRKGILNFRGTYRDLSDHTRCFKKLILQQAATDRRSNIPIDEDSLVRRFLDATCSCDQPRFRPYHGQQHSAILWPNTAHARKACGNKVVIYPENVRKINTHLKNIFDKQQVLKEWNDNAIAKKKGIVSVHRNPESGNDQSISLDDEISDSEDDLGTDSLAQVEHNISLRSKEQSPIDAYLSSLYPTLGAHAEDEGSSDKDKVSYLQGQEVESWSQKAVLIVERYLHKNTLYFIDPQDHRGGQMKTYSAALYDLVAKLKDQLELTCDKANDSNVAERCKRFISKRTKEWIHSDKFLTVDNPVYSFPLFSGIQQSMAFSSKLNFLRKKWEKQQNFAALGKVDGVIEGGSSDVSKGKRRRQSSSELSKKCSVCGDKWSSLQYLPPVGSPICDGCQLYVQSQSSSTCNAVHLAKKQKTGESSKSQNTSEDIEIPDIYDFNESSGNEADVQVPRPRPLVSRKEPLSATRSERQRRITRSPGTVRPLTPPELGRTSVANVRSDIPCQDWALPDGFIRRQEPIEIPPSPGFRNMESTQKSLPIRSPGTVQSPSAYETSSKQLLSPISTHKPGIKPALPIFAINVAASGSSQQQKNSTQQMPAQQISARQASQTANTNTTNLPTSIAPKTPIPQTSHTILPTPPPTQPKPKIEILLHLWRPTPQLSAPYPPTLLSQTCTSFFEFYSSKSQIPLLSITQLEFSFPQARPYRTRIVTKNDEEEWEDLKDNLRGLVGDVRKAVREGRRVEVRIFEVVVRCLGWEFGDEGEGGGVGVGEEMVGDLGF